MEKIELLIENRKKYLDAGSKVEEVQSTDKAEIMLEEVKEP